MDIPPEGSSSWERQTVATSTEEQEFLDWLRRNGALFHDVLWPSSDTQSGMRGAIAARNIDSGDMYQAGFEPEFFSTKNQHLIATANNMKRAIGLGQTTGEYALTRVISSSDHMIQIPQAVMMSEFHAKADPDFGRVHRLHTRLLDNDNGLAVYIMQEMLKEEKSFYWPYLRVLPTPYNLRGWNGEHLLLLQDHKLVRRVAARRRQLRMLYDDTIEYLSNNYPELYSIEQYTFELFDFAWSTVQARAFGKRLKSSALVPLADCLNHGNVQTKYDFDPLFHNDTNKQLYKYGKRNKPFSPFVVKPT